MLHFTNECMFDIINTLQTRLEAIRVNEKIEFCVLNPDTLTSSYTGKTITIENQEYIYRSFKAWTDLSEILFCKMLTPRLINENLICLSFVKLNTTNSFHQEEESCEKYGVNSTFANINKNEEPAFIAYYTNALKNAKLDTRVRILNLGVNSGEEFEVIKSLSNDFKNHELVGIDYSQSAIEKAKENFPDKNISFYAHDINKLDTLNLGKFDLIVSIGTLQSSNINLKTTFMSLVQNYLNKDGAIILGFPNCRWIDGEMIYGAKAKNYSYSEKSVLYKDVYFCKKYLQQKKFRVTVTGKNYIFLTGTSIR